MLFRSFAAAQEAAPFLRKGWPVPWKRDGLLGRFHGHWANKILYPYSRTHQFLSLSQEEQVPSLTLLAEALSASLTFGFIQKKTTVCLIDISVQKRACWQSSDCRQ